MLKQADKFLNDDLLSIENHILKPTKKESFWPMMG
jgi:hypothetical protein